MGSGIAKSATYLWGICGENLIALNEAETGSPVVEKNLKVIESVSKIRYQCFIKIKTQEKRAWISCPCKNIISTLWIPTYQRTMILNNVVWSGFKFFELSTNAVSQQNPQLFGITLMNSNNTAGKFSSLNTISRLFTKDDTFFFDWRVHILTEGTRIVEDFVSSWTTGNFWLIAGFAGGAGTIAAGGNASVAVDSLTAVVTLKLKVL